MGREAVWGGGERELLDSGEKKVMVIEGRGSDVDVWGV